MAFEQESAVLTGNSSFEEMLDTACERLREKQIEYSIRRITALELELDRIEKELNTFIGSVHG